MRRCEATANPGMDGYRRLLGDPLQQVQRLLGHASLTTTYLYLDHLVDRADTVDAAVEELAPLSGRNEARAGLLSISITRRRQRPSIK